MAIPVDNRRQSGLWQQSPSTGFYEKQPSTSSSAPYTYYQPPQDKRRSTFSERAGNTAPLPSGGSSGVTERIVGAAQNGVGWALDPSKIREITQATSEKIAGAHEYGHTTTSDDLARVGHASSIHSPTEPSSSAQVQNALRGVDPESKIAEVTRSASEKLASSRDLGHTTTSDDLARTQHVNSVPAQQPLRVDPNAVPANVRTKPWSPEPTSSTAQKPRQFSNASDIVRRGSVPDRSPLQKLEAHLDDRSKEEKRARLEEMEYRARQKSQGRTVMPAEGDMLRQGTLRSEKGRIVSDGSRRPSESSTDKYYRQVSAGAPQAMPPSDTGLGKFRQASSALKDETAQPSTYLSYPSRDATAPTREQSLPQSREAAPHPAVTKEARPYRHAPEAPRSLDRGGSLRQPGAAAPVAREARPYHHAPEAPRSMNSVKRQSGGVPPVAQEARPYHHAPAEPLSRAASQRQSGGVPPVAQEARPYHHAPAEPLSRAASQRQSGEVPPVAQEARPYHHAPAEPLSRAASQRQPGSRGVESGAGAAPPESLSRDTSQRQSGAGDSGMYRSASGKYKRRLRDAGFAGAAAAAAGAAGVGAYEATAADRGKAAYEKRKNQENAQQASPISPTSRNGVGFGRSNSKKLQKRSAPTNEWRDQGQSGYRQSDQGRNGYPQSQDQQQRDLAEPEAAKQALQTDRMGGDGRAGKEAAEAYQKPDPLPRDQVATDRDEPVAYMIPPQTAAGQAARQPLGFHEDQADDAQIQSQERHHHLRDILHHHGEKRRSYQPGVKPLDEWRGAQVGRLSASDLELDGSDGGAGKSGKDAWWEQERSRRTSSSGTTTQPPARYDGPYEEEAKLYRPPLFSKCGPLLRYTGIRKEPSRSGGGEREIWRGSVMIVTEDGQSDYSSAPTLRLFAQPMDLHQPPSREMLESGHEIPPEISDPVAGQVKASRTGRPLYVRPVHDIRGGLDLSGVENNDGLYAATRTPMLGPQFSQGSDGRHSQHITFQDKSRIKRRDGEKAGRYRDVKAIRLHAERGFTFWRWSIEIELGSTQHRVAYRVNRGPALGFWVPARGETMNIMFHSCNGFSLSVDSRQFSGPDPLWRDVLNRHQARPFHVMIGGGDQIYNDAATRDTTLFREWLQIKNPEHKLKAEFTPEMQEELESFYLNRYSMWFSQGLFAMANSQIPMVNLWDDHDIIDGYGSYSHHQMSTAVFTGLGAIAFKYYMLFQHQSVIAETTNEEPSWVLGKSPGPYIDELSRSVFLSMGNHVAFIGIDCRTERMRDMILSRASYDMIFDRCWEEIQKGQTKHLIVLLGVPIAYPRLNFLENILTSKAMDPIKAIGRTGMLGGFVNKFDGGVEILDDLDDHWTAKHHKAERNWFIQHLQDLAAEKSVRITILGGDVHLGAVGQFYTTKKLGVQKDRDHRYMPNVISSAIVNTPPPPMMADVLNKRNKVHHLDDETDEDMIPMFDADVDGSKRNNKTLLPRRNYCTIREFAPGSTPPSSPPPERDVPGTPGSGYDQEENERNPRDRRYPPGSMGRTMSLTKGPGKLIRRLSGSSRGKNPPVSLGPDQTRPYSQQNVGRSQSLSGSNRASFDAGGPPQWPNTFHRRPTNLSEKEVRRAAAKGGAPDEDQEGDDRAPGHINLEGGLDISLNMEIDQHDPSGATQPYRLLVPALWYEGREGTPDANQASVPSRGKSFMDRFRGGRKKEYEDEEYYSGSEEETPPPSRGQQGQQLRGPTEVPIAGGGNRTMQKPSYGKDGAYEDGMAPQSRPGEQPGNTYLSGYGPSPSTGAAKPSSRSSATNNSYSQQQQQPGSYRRSSAPVSQKHSQQVPGPYSPAQDEYSEGSRTPSDEYNDAPPARTTGVQPRRLSKAERFLGMGDEGGAGRRASMQNDDGGYVDGKPEKKKPNWMVWR